MTERPILHVVSLSGGKDSTATALVAIELHGRENCRFVFADTGNEHEATYEYALEYLPRALGINVDVVDLRNFYAQPLGIVAPRRPLHAPTRGKGFRV